MITVVNPIFRRFSQNWPFSDNRVNKKCFLKPEWSQKSLKSTFLQRTSVSHIFLAESNIYKSITIRFKKIFECILRFVSLILFWEVCCQNCTWIGMWNLKPNSEQQPLESTSLELGNLWHFPNKKKTQWTSRQVAMG